MNKPLRFKVEYTPQPPDGIQAILSLYRGTQEMIWERICSWGIYGNPVCNNDLAKEVEKYITDHYHEQYTIESNE